MTPQEAGRSVAAALAAGRKACVPGATYGDVVLAVERSLAADQMRSLVSGYGTPPFPLPLCVSVGYTIMHGVVRPDRLVLPGEVVRLDLAAQALDGSAAADSAITFLVSGWGINRDTMRGSRYQMFQDALGACSRSLEAGISQVVPGRPVSEATVAMHSEIVTSSTALAERGGTYLLSGLSAFCGHGIGANSMHLDPLIPSYRPGSRNGGQEVFEEGKTYCIEPAVYPYLRLGDHDSFTILQDGWSVQVASDLGVHLEHTVLCTADGPIVLTA